MNEENIDAVEGVSNWEEKVGLAKMLVGGVIMDVTNAEQARIAEEAGAAAVMAPVPARRPRHSAVGPRSTAITSVRPSAPGRSSRNPGMEYGIAMIAP